MPGHSSHLCGLGARTDLSAAWDGTDCGPSCWEKQGLGRKGGLGVEGTGRGSQCEAQPPSHICENEVMEQNMRKTMSFTRGGRGQPSDQFR